jgi:chorismate dehydratase
MSEQHQLRVGRISYLNSVPYFELLEKCGFEGELYDGVPSALNRMLSDGEVDASLSSSIAYARNWRDYLVLPGHSISSCGEVKSVLFFSPQELEQMDGQTVYLTRESETSICLLKIVLEAFFKLENVNYATTDESLEDLVARNESVLLIGDRALRMAAACPEATHCYDLGELWFQATGLPFVFALWMVRKEAAVASPEAVKALDEQLQLSRQQVLGNIVEHAEKSAQRTGFEQALVQAYWQTIDYRLDKAHIYGLRLFYVLARKLGLLKETSKLVFFDLADESN